ncbi:MAG: hypothetical protein EXR73_04260 [Myxococcales bacterium]|nr:hypothetical protein [Myxococcales bacterium]
MSVAQWTEPSGNPGDSWTRKGTDVATLALCAGMALAGAMLASGAGFFGITLRVSRYALPPAAEVVMGVVLLLVAALCAVLLGLNARVCPMCRGVVKTVATSVRQSDEQALRSSLEDADVPALWPLLLRAPKSGPRLCVNAAFCKRCKTIGEVSLSRSDGNGTVPMAACVFRGAQHAPVWRLLGQVAVESG